MQRTPLVASLLALALVACGDGDGPSSEPAAPGNFEDTPGAPTVTLAAGKLTGTGTDILAFKGIPYAKAPIATLRWHAPVDADPWTGTLDATKFGPQCMQAGTAPMSEDCLFINVWAPKTAVASNGKLPVLVWVFGGSFHGGNGNIDGTPLAQKGAVVVSMNYRVSTLGFMAHPQLSAESPDKVSGNYGILDIAQSFKWVKANIERFGGDPAKVTVFGVSSGASAISAFMSSPRSAGLFQRAILESPGSWRPWKTLATAEADGTAVGASIADLRAVPAAQVPVIRNTGGGTAIRALAEPRIIGPTMDGVVLPHSERLQYESGGSTAVPLIVGNNTDEGSTFTGAYPITTVAGYRAYLKDPRVFGSFGDAAFGTYPAASDDEVRRNIALSFGDHQFWHGARGIARTFTNRGMPVYRYVFTRRQAGGTGVDAQHGDEVKYVFGESVLNAAPYTADDVRLSDAMMEAWVRFAASADPNGGIINDWPKYDIFTEPVYRLDATFQVLNGPRNAQLDFIKWFDASIPVR